MTALNIKEIILSPEILELFKKRHLSRLSDSIYLEGFKSSESKNPYIFDKELEIERIKISLKNGPLTKEEIHKSKELDQKMRETPWVRWSSGNFAQKYFD